MHDSIFREYDIRGIVGSELQLEHVYLLGCALAYYFIHQNTPVRTVAVGMDGRIHSAHIHTELIQALRDSGLHVISVGLCPTPVLYFSMYTLPVEAGIMITASHNGKDYNGMKIGLSKGPVWGRQIDAIKELYKKKKKHNAALMGTYQEYPMVERYTDWLVQQFQHLKKSSLRVSIDCGNGATGVIVPQLVAKMGWTNISVLYDTVDGNFPNHEPDPGSIENSRVLQKTVIQTNSCLGIGFDGDGDRMVALAKDGSLIPGDKLLALYAQDIIATHPDAAIVLDVKCSIYLSELLVKWGARPFIAPSGHSVIKHEMKKQRALLAGELSCHFYFNDRYFGYDDGIYAALRLIELIHTGKSLEKLLALFPPSFSTPEIRIKCAQEIKHRLLEAMQRTFAARADARVSTIDGIKALLPYGWGLVRFSNTQSVVCLRFEAATTEGLKQVKEDFYAVLVEYVDEKTLWDSLFR